MELLQLFVPLILAVAVLVPLVRVKYKGWITLSAVFTGIAITSILAIQAIKGIKLEWILPGSLVTGPVPLRLDALSGWFILIINFTFFTGSIYGFHYMKAYREQSSNISMHAVAFFLHYTALMGVCMIQNGIVFLIDWEVMALTAFILVIFEHQKRETLKAGINYLIQSHVSILFLTLGFIWVSGKTGSFDFHAIQSFTGAAPVFASVVLFIVFFIGFAIKAGFVPFHTWLPHAHPAAPSHISGIMSGVIIKAGIYGILRMVLLIKSDYIIIGYIVLVISVVSGVYGVMLAILQHNLKKLLAYHSVENIGIIGIGIGLGCIGLGYNNQVLIILGFAGAMLHVLNHSLFKSLLFFAAGNVYQSVHTMLIETLGGIGKKMPQTALLFLIASLAICGLPPFNGFISEFLIYNGMFSSLKGSDIPTLSVLIFAITGLTLIGGLALLCFTKAFGTVFLGNPRTRLSHVPREQEYGKLLPMYLIIAVMLFIGLFPQILIQVLTEPVRLFSGYPGFEVSFMHFPFTDTLTKIGWGSLIFLGLIALIFFIRRLVTTHQPVAVGPTWGCGYVAPTPKIQYTASSFVRTYIKLAEPLLLIHKRKKDVEGIFPKDAALETHPDDKAEFWLIDYPLVRIKHLFSKFTFLQNGNPQVYVLYGMIFITFIIFLPVIYEGVKALVIFLNQL